MCDTKPDRRLCVDFTKSHGEGLDEAASNSDGNEEVQPPPRSIVTNLNTHVIAFVTILTDKYHYDLAV